MEQTGDIIIVGAGAAGLMAASRLSESGKRIIVLEARDRIGGRVHTLTDAPFAQAVELGAEFVHGELPLTLDLLKKAGISTEPVKGDPWTSSGGRFHQDDAIGEDWPILMQKLDALETDCTIKTFLDQEFGEERYEDLRRSVIRFAEGYDAADTNRASAIALREEWKGEDEPQYRVTGGYGRLMSFLMKSCDPQTVSFHLEQPVTEIRWAPGDVRVTTADGSKFFARKIILTIPVGVWQESTHAPRLLPGPEDHMAAIRQLGFGPVIKFLFQFRAPFWKEKETARRIGQNLDRLGFLFSEANVPTWWTQYPATNSVLTGWLAGPAAAARKGLDKPALLRLALQSLSVIFRMSEAELEENLAAWEIADWSAHPYTAGAYTYATVDTAEAVRILSQPVADTIYFAGEAIYSGPAMGTLEAALSSGYHLSIAP